jgi:nitrous oxidase accessory protein
MGRRIGILAATAFLVVCAARDLYAEAYYRMLFERAVFLLETRIEPRNAIPIFQEIVRRHGDDRYYAARSQLYIGLCLKKEGSDQAAQALREVLKNYPEQGTIRAIAEAELRGLRVDVPRPGSRREKEAARLVRRFESGQKLGGLSLNGRFAVLTEMGTDGLTVIDLARQETLRLDRSRLAGPAAGFVEEAAISPDGMRIVYSWRRDSGEIDLRSIRREGGRGTTLLSDPGMVGIHFAAWEHGGDKVLAVLRGLRGTARAVLLCVADGSTVPVMDLGARWPGPILPSPDGRYIAYSLSEDPLIPDGDIFLYSIAEKKTMPLVRQAGDDRLLAWTLDGRGIIYACAGPEAAGIWLLTVTDGIPLPPARWIAGETGPLDPIGLTEDGSLFFRVEAESGKTVRPGRIRHELWLRPHFLPEIGRVLTVPGAFPSIQAAIAAANVGDTVLLGPGAYHESVVIGKPLHLRGEAWQTTTIVGGGAGSVVRITAGDVSVSGIAVTGGTDGIEIAAGPTVRRVVLENVAAVRNARDGLRSFGSGGYHRIEGCTVAENGEYGMNVHQFSGSLIRDCDASRNGTGLRPAWSWDVLLQGNRIHHNRSRGLLIDSCYRCMVSGNLIHANAGAGLSVYYIAGRNTIKENILIRNEAGIDINLHWGGFGENRFYHNDLIENREQVRLRSAGGSRFQIWDMGGPGGGNFWSDRSGRQAGGGRSSGTGHELVGGARDRFPLQRPGGRILAELVFDPVGPAGYEPRQWMTAHIELPAGLSPDGIDRATLRLNGSLAPKATGSAEGDADGDGTPDLEVRFLATDVRRVLEGMGACGETFVTGKLNSGLPFEAREMPKGKGR